MKTFKESKIDSTAWVAKLSDQELPALASTVRALSRLSQDDLTALSDIGNSIIHDSALTTSILKIANQMSRQQANSVTTVSRACVILGFKKLRNICLTVKLIGGLLKNDTLSKPVYIMLLRLMSQSFHAAMLAKMMVAKYDDDTQEEIFIATLLTHLGESAFWSMGGEITHELEFNLRQVSDPKKRKLIISEQLGTSFEELNHGLAKAWNLSEVLIKSMDNPTTRTQELQVIELADEASKLFAQRDALPSKKNKLIERIAIQLGVTNQQAVKQINACKHETLDMLESFGIKILKQFVAQQDVIYIPMELEQQEATAQRQECTKLDPNMQLKWLRQLTMLCANRVGFNQVIELSIEAITEGLAMDKVIMLMFDSEQDAVVPRFHNHHCDGPKLSKFHLPVHDEENLFSFMQQELMPVWVRRNIGERYKSLISKELAKAASPKGYFLAPLVVKHKCIGFMYVDRSFSKRSLTNEDFAAFEHFCQLTSLCLAAVR